MHLFFMTVALVGVGKRPVASLQKDINPPLAPGFWASGKLIWKFVAILIVTKRYENMLSSSLTLLTLSRTIKINGMGFIVTAWWSFWEGISVYREKKSTFPL